MASAKPPADPELREKLTTLVGRLTADLGIGGGRSAEGLAAASVAMLSKMTSPYDVTKVAVQQTQKTLTENAPDKRAFASEYARLKAMNVRELDKYLNVVAKIVQDPDLLAAVSTPRAPTRDDEADSSRRASRDIVPPAAPAAPPAEARDDPATTATTAAPASTTIPASTSPTPPGCPTPAARTSPPSPWIPSRSARTHWRAKRRAPGRAAAPPRVRITKDGRGRIRPSRRRARPALAKTRDR